MEVSGGDFSTMVLEEAKNFNCLWRFKQIDHSSSPSPTITQNKTTSNENADSER